MTELVYVSDLKSDVRNHMWVRVPLPALITEAKYARKML